MVIKAKEVIRLKRIIAIILNRIEAIIRLYRKRSYYHRYKGL